MINDTNKRIKELCKSKDLQTALKIVLTSIDKIIDIDIIRKKIYEN